MTLKNKIIGSTTIIVGAIALVLLEMKKTAKEIAAACSKIGETK